MDSSTQANWCQTSLSDAESRPEWPAGSFASVTAAFSAGRQKILNETFMAIRYFSKGPDSNGNFFRGTYLFGVPCAAKRHNPQRVTSPVGNHHFDTSPSANTKTKWHHYIIPLYNTQGK